MNTQDCDTPIQAQQQTELFPLQGKVHLPDFVVAMLRVGRILTEKADVVREVTPQRISRIMERYRSQMPQVYRPKEIRENWEYHNCYLEGGRIMVEANEIEGPTRGPLHYQFSFTRQRGPEAPPVINQAPQAPGHIGAGADV